MKTSTCSFRILRRTFVRQLGDNDCGQACLAMLLRYAGETGKARDLLDLTITGDLSLKGLETLMYSYGYRADCVTMDLEYLSKIQTPCILHTENGAGDKHYQVCYGARRTIYGLRLLMADPAKHFYLISLADLDQLWKSKAALYVADLRPNLIEFRKSPVIQIMASVNIPPAIWIVMPALTLINVLFGVALSFLLQRGMIYSDIFGSVHLIVAITTLLLVISLFKGGFAYLKQLILLRINRNIRHLFWDSLLGKLNEARPGFASGNPNWPKRLFSEIGQIQNAVSLLLATLVSEGSLLIILCAAVAYIVPAAGFVLTVFLIAVFSEAISSLPDTLYANSTIRQKSAAIEKLLGNATNPQGITVKTINEQELVFHSMAEREALRLSRKGLFQETAGALTVVIILLVTSWQLYSMRLSYTSLMSAVVLSYFAVAIVPRLQACLFSFAEGMDVYMQFRLRTER